MNEETVEEGTPAHRASYRKVAPDEYWVSIGKLKANYGSRGPAGLPQNINLKFIPEIRPVISGK